MGSSEQDQIICREEVEADDSGEEEAIEGKGNPMLAPLCFFSVDGTASGF
jgi:hypothetical protein